MEIYSEDLGRNAIRALDKAIDGLAEVKAQQLIDPQEAANLTARFLHLKGLVLRAMGEREQAESVDKQVTAIFTQPTLWEDDLEMPEPCQPIGCDHGMHLAGCYYAVIDEVS